MQLDLDSADKVFHMAIALGTLAVAWVGLAIKAALGKIALTQAQDKAELVEHQTQIKEDLNRKHAENSQNLAVHTAEDRAIFAGFSATQTRTDAKLDRIETKLDQLSGLKRI
jgi:hypothetical protein